MNFKKFFLTMSLALVIAVSGCSPITAPTNVNAAFESFTLQLFQEEVAASTLGLHYTLQRPRNHFLWNLLYRQHRAPRIFGKFAGIFQAIPLPETL